MASSISPGSPTLFVRMRGIAKAFGPVQALKGIDLDIYPSEVHCLAGENGAGKSTLIKILTGAINRDSGEYRIEEKEIGNPGPAQLRASGIGVVYQELSLLPDLSVEENLMMGRFPAARGFVRKQELHTMAKKMLERVGLGHIDPETPLETLTVATRQMIEIAKVLGANARLLIFDEPTTALSDEEAQRLMSLIMQLKSEGVAILYITHRLEEIFAMADRITVMRDGQLVTTAPASQFNHDSLIRTMVGRQIEALYPRREDKQFGRVLLDIQDLHLHGSPYPINLYVRAGEILGIGGLVGSGRTSLLRAIFGADTPDTGEVKVDGKLVRPGSPQASVDAGLGLLTEDRKEQGLMLELSIMENVLIANFAGVSRSGFVSRKRENGVLDSLLPRLRLKFHSNDQPVSSLSGGNQQKVLLARWMATRAKVLLFDEPTKGVDIGAKADIYTLIGDLASSGLGIVVVSSYLPELLGICDRVITVHDGGLTGEVPIAEATEEKVLSMASQAPVLP